MRLLRVLPWWLMLLVVLARLSAAAQETASISGAVRDGSGTPLSGVSVTLTGKQIQVFVKHTVSSSSGSYQFADVPVGEYAVTAAFSGYAEAGSAVIRVAAGLETTKTDLVLTRMAGQLTPKLQLQAAGLHGLIDPGGYSASTGAAAASGVVAGIADIKRADGSFQPLDAKQWPCSLEPELRRAVEDHPGEAAASKRLGHFYLAHQQPARAIPLLTRALQIDSLDDTASLDLATAWLESGKFGEARSLLVALAARHNGPEVHQLLARAEEGLGLFEQAAQEYQAAYNEQPSEDRLFGEGYEWLLAASLDHAMEVFLSGERQYPHSLPMWMGAGAVEILRGHTDDGAHDFLEASKLAPSDPRPYSLLASVSGIAKAESALVRSSFERYVKSEPQNASANYFYAVSLLQQDGPDKDQAGRFLKRAIELEPGLARAHLALANLDAENKKYDEAVGEYEAAVRLEPGLSEAHYRLALAYKRAGHAEQSAREVQIFQQEKNRQSTDGSSTDLAQFISALDTPVEKSQESQCGVSSH